ncbi:MAG: segregation/condensation protein A [Candidatus Kerfeldbacteria bacterium]|nr:segregation/condensation protein A [Candidatus Kerfeldbacteria bacterium]
MRHVQTATFSGPLELLLSLIEQEQLDISHIALAKVTEQYIAELQKMEELPLDELADFLVVAAKLLLIKSRLMVPTAGHDDDQTGAELEQQLRLYQVFVKAAAAVDRLYRGRRTMYARDGYAMMEPIFNPPSHLTADGLAEIFHGVLRQLEPITRLPQTVMIRTINIRQKINQIKDHLLSVRRTSFHQLLGQAKNKTEAIITFLAVLELVKLQSAAVVQDRHYADMSIEILDRISPEPVPQ